MTDYPLQTYNAIFIGGPSMPDGTKSIGRSLAEIHSRVNTAPTLTDLNGAVLNLAADALNKHNAVMAKLDEILAKLI